MLHCHIDTNTCKPLKIQVYTFRFLCYYMKGDMLLHEGLQITT